jgi:seryl-tRNA synthetase
MPKKRKISSSESKREHVIEDRIIENLVGLQKVHTDLAEKFDNLSKEISNLLKLFEMAAKSFGKNSLTKGADTDKEFLNKIDKLLEQNKTIAKGLTLMESQMKKKVYGREDDESESLPSQVPEGYSPSINASRPLPRF